MQEALNYIIEVQGMVLKMTNFVIYAEKEVQLLPLFKLKTHRYSGASQTFLGVQKLKSMRSKKKVSILAFYSKLKRIII